MSRKRAGISSMFIKSEKSNEVIKEDLDLTEEALDFVPPVLHQNGFQYGKSKASKEILRSQGIVIRDGNWTEKEDALLLKNWGNFVKNLDIKDPMFLLGVNQSNAKLLQKFITAKKMYVRLGKGLNNRTLYSIYLRARTILNPNRNTGRLTANEVQTLARLITKYGCKFVKIASLMNKSVSTCRSSYRWNIKNLKHGQWSVEEDIALCTAIKKLAKIGNGKSQTDTLPWKAIAKYVPGRNSSQCLHRWLVTLRKGKKKRWTKENDACLIYLIHADFSNDEVDWHSLYKKFHLQAVSYATIHRRWAWLKAQAQCYKKNHKYVVRYMYNYYLPVLLQQLGMSMKSLKSMANGLVSSGEDAENISLASHSLEALNMKKNSRDRSQPYWWKSVTTVSASIGHQHIEPTYLNKAVEHFVPYKFRLFVTVLNVEPQLDSVQKLVRLYCPECHYLSEDANPDLEIYQIRSKVPFYLCPVCSSEDLDDKCRKQVLVYTFVLSFTLSDGTSMIEAYMWKQNAVAFFKGIKPEDALADSSKADAVLQMLWNICPNCHPFESTNGMSSLASNSGNSSYYPVLDCCVMSYTAGGKTRYQIFDTKLK